MRRYETIVIVDPDLGENDRTSLFDRIKEIIPQQEGVFINEDFWGTKKLAYEIKKKPRGFYARFEYCGMGPVVDEIERFFRIDDRVMKYLTVMLDEEADPESILAEMAAETSVDETISAKTEQTSESETTPEAAAEATPSAKAAVDAQPATETEKKE
jgi:small subunit ribosomal protein S6